MQSASLDQCPGDARAGVKPATLDDMQPALLDQCPGDCWLAPTELYIVMAITVATFSWLLVPRRPGDPPLAAWIVWPSLAFLLLQVIQIVAYRDIENRWPSLPAIMHQSTLLLYAVGLCVLLWSGWLNALPADPDLPENAVGEPEDPEVPEDAGEPEDDSASENASELDPAKPEEDDDSDPE